MIQQLTDRKDVQFVLHEQLNMIQLTKGEQFNDLNRKTFDMVLAEARSLAIKELLPTNIDSDREGCTFENGFVKVPASFHRAYKLIKEGEWIALSDDIKVNGQGMPQLITTAVMEMFHGANTSLAAFLMLGHGAGKLVEIFGTEKQKELFLDNIYSGKWGGTMVLTEPEAGSDVGALTTRAVKNADGTYSLSGNKIFISCAEHDLTENIINPVIARIEGAPKGSAGISLFIVPKIWVNEDGTPGEPNDIVCTGIEEKIGLHGGPTCSLTLGGKDCCRGMLLGEENKGLKTMFHMMNEERLNVAVQALGVASTAYLYAVNYARERLQGKHLTRSREPDAPQVPIIQHPDVRRMLLWMKAQVDANRSFNYYIALCMDKIKITESKEEREYLEDLIELLTPICKAYTTERACEVCLQAIQVYGGYGACKDFPVEQLFRDCKITTIYEGTTGIQCMDLLGRKLGMKKGKVFKGLIKEIQKTIAQAGSIPELQELSQRMAAAVDKYAETALKLGQTAASSKIMVAFSHANPFMDISGEIMMAWMVLWRAAVAAPELSKIIGDADREKRTQIIEKNKDAAFYDGQVQTARYFIRSILPGTLGKMDAVTETDGAAVEIADISFGG
ncbi:MAG: acyl-CoA dehydrogenase [Thermodesulfobacteriota bacterium]|nr:acyl-CoA dehydrogenase [Thermodesulfobacteriota bacterium]